MNSNTVSNDCGDTTLNDHITYWCNNKNVTVVCNCTYGGTIANSLLSLGTIPSKYKPRNNVSFPVALTKSDGSIVTGYGIIEATGGGISVKGQNTAWVQYNYINFTVTYGID